RFARMAGKGEGLEPVRWVDDGSAAGSWVFAGAGRSLRLRGGQDAGDGKAGGEYGDGCDDDQQIAQAVAGGCLVQHDLFLVLTGRLRRAAYPCFSSTSLDNLCAGWGRACDPPHVAQSP